MPLLTSENQGGSEHTSASLCSENYEMKSAVEMTPGGKRGKLKKTKASFPLFPPGLEIRQKTRTSDSHISPAPAAGLYQQGRTKMKVQPDSS